MWAVHDYGWGIGMLAWMLFVWTAVGVTIWFILHTLGGPRPHTHH